MTDLLIRDVNEATLLALSAGASSRGISREEYVRRELDNLARTSTRPPLTAHDLSRAAELVRDVLDPQAMAGAWS